MPCVRGVSAWSRSMFVVELLRLLGIYLLIANRFVRFGFIFQWILGMRYIGFLTPRALLLHWRQCAPSRHHIRVLLSCFILWQVWKAHNAFRFHSQSVFVDAIIFQVDFNVQLASSVFGFKPSQLMGVFDSWIAEGLQVMSPFRQPIRLVSWMRPPHGVNKLTMDGCSRGNLGMAASRVFCEIIEVWF